MSNIHQIKRTSYLSHTLIYDDQSRGWYAEKEIGGVTHRSRVYSYSQDLQVAIEFGTIRLEPIPLDQVDRSRYDKDDKTWLEHVIPQGTIGRYDLLPAFQDAELFHKMVDTLVRQFDRKADYVAAPEALGWILGSAMAHRLRVGFIGIRKEGVLPYPASRVQQQVYTDYSGHEKTLCIPMHAIRQGSRIVIVDEWIDTGATVQACIDLIASAQCRVIGIAAIGIDRNPITEEWIRKGLLKFLSDDVKVP